MLVWEPKETVMNDPSLANTALERIGAGNGTFGKTTVNLRLPGDTLNCGAEVPLSWNAYEYSPAGSEYRDDLKESTPAAAENDKTEGRTADAETAFNNTLVHTMVTTRLSTGKALSVTVKKF